MVASLTNLALLILVNENLQVIILTITSLIQGIVPTVALSLYEAEEAFELLSDIAEKQGQQLMFMQPGQLFTISAITYVRNRDFQILLLVPMVAKQNEMIMHIILYYLQSIYKTAIQWLVQSGLVASKPTIYPMVEYTYIPDS